MASAAHPLTPELCLTFVALARCHGSVAAAARELGIGQAAASKRLRPLHQAAPPHLPRPWLVKRGRKFHLTDSGRAALPRAEEMAGEWGRFIAAAAADPAPGVAVACGQEATGGLVLSAARAFRAAHPDAVLRVAAVRGRRRVEGVAAGTYDVALVTYPRAMVGEIARRDMTVEPLAEDRLVVVAASGSPWAAALGRSAPAEAAEAAGWPLVLPEADSPIRRQWDERVGRRGGPAARVAVEVGGWRAVLGYVLAGFGVGLMPRSVAASAGKTVTVREIADGLRPANRLNLVTRPGARGDLVATLAEALKAASAKHATA